MEHLNLMTLDEVAEQLRKSPATLRYWRASGIGPPSAKLGRRIVYREDDVRTWLEQQFAATPAAAS